MGIVLWDASGLVKRYFREAGSDTADAIFQTPAVSQMSVTLWGYAECASILNRKRNSKLIDAAAYAISVTSLQQEVLLSSQFKILTIEDDRILAGLPLLVKHNLNSNDAAILATYLRFQQSLPPSSPPCFLVAADQRLLRAAETEGLRTLNPEAAAPQDIAARLAGGSA
jgi:predicted nucleic acid-binding protein